MGTDEPTLADRGRALREMGSITRALIPEYDHPRPALTYHGTDGVDRYITEANFDVNDMPVKEQALLAALVTLVEFMVSGDPNG